MHGLCTIVFTMQLRQLILLACLLMFLSRCASRPINPSMSYVNPVTGYRVGTKLAEAKERENFVVLTFSGGGIRAAAFSYGVLEFLEHTEVRRPDGRTTRLLDDVEILTGVSGGSFTSLAYGLYGDALFRDYPQRFLKNNMQGELLARWLNPVNWPNLATPGWGRSELAAGLYDEILFNGATYADLRRRGGPLVLVSATDISTGFRFVFSQDTFDVLCSNLENLPISRAAAASSAVPVIFSPVTLNNYGGSCESAIPPWMKVYSESPDPPRLAPRAIRDLKMARRYVDGVDLPYIHLVGGGVSDNDVMRGLLNTLETLEVSRYFELPSPIATTKRIIVFVVDSLSVPEVTWGKSERPPGMLSVLLKAANVPIDLYSGEEVEQLRDISARWRTMRKYESVRPEIPKVNSRLENALSPSAEIYVIDVSLAGLRDRAEFEYLNNLPTSMALPGDAVDRLRAAAKVVILASPEFQRLLRDVGASLVE